MQLCDINPFMRFAGLQPSVKSNVPFCRAYDHRIFYVLEGDGCFIYGERRIAIGTGTLLFFGPNKPYYFEGKIKIIVLNFDLTRAQADKTQPMDPLATLNNFNESYPFETDVPAELSELLVVKNAFEVEKLLERCLICYREETPLADARTSAVIKALLCYAVQKGGAESPESPEIVQRIRIYLQQNYDKSISNTEISREFGYHSYYLNRIFKKHTGITIHQALLKEKISVAETLLRETELSVGEVAGETGFADRTHFCNAFKMYTGYTPTAYRKKA